MHLFKTLSRRFFYRYPQAHCDYKCKAFVLCSLRTAIQGDSNLCTNTPEDDGEEELIDVLEFLTEMLRAVLRAQIDLKGLCST